jgi:hypothetical protein
MISNVFWTTATYRVGRDKALIVLFLLVGARVSRVKTAAWRRDSRGRVLEPLFGQRGWDIACAVSYERFGIAVLFVRQPRLDDLKRFARLHQFRPAV